MNQAYYLWLRLMRLVLVLVGLSIIIFVVARLVPGDPARIALGPLATPAQVQALHIKMGIDQPIVVQYFDYIANLFQADMGQSTVTDRPVLTDITSALPATLELVLVAITFTACIGMPLGILAAYRPNGLFDQISRITSLVGVVTPSFLIALMLQLAASLGWIELPVTERLSASFNYSGGATGLILLDSALQGRWDVWVNALQHILLPALALSAAGISQVMRITRSSMIEFSHRDHVETLRA